MKTIAKYNSCKGASISLTFLTPIVTLLSCGDFIVKNDGASISAAGVFVILISLLLTKDKILENFKMPPAFVLCLVILILVCMIEAILMPIKIVCITTMISTGIDEFTFKRAYKVIETTLPENAKLYKHVGFICTSSKNLGV